MYGSIYVNTPRRMSASERKNKYFKNSRKKYCFKVRMRKEGYLLIIPKNVDFA